MSSQGPTGACVTPALAALRPGVIRCRWTGGGVSLLSGLLEAWPSWRMPLRVLRTLWFGGTLGGLLFTRVSYACWWPPDRGFFFSQMGLERQFAWGSSPVCISIFKPFILACFLCLENKLLFVLLSRVPWEFSGFLRLTSYTSLLPPPAHCLLQ